MKVLKHERGSVLLYVAGSLIMMMLFVGLAIDGGWTTYVRNQGQAAVDAAALSAASAITDYKKGTATSTTIERRAADPSRAGGARRRCKHPEPSLAEERPRVSQVDCGSPLMNYCNWLATLPHNVLI